MFKYRSYLRMRAREARACLFLFSMFVDPFLFLSPLSFFSFNLNQSTMNTADGLNFDRKKKKNFDVFINGRHKFLTAVSYLFWEYRKSLHPF